ncbi:DUF2142 domain-containing protein [Dorea longicatena]|uniref:DUF2142 domain-containing protein n=1 Tax=Dorea longicatena TaxID=88431 RepID=UPI0022DF4F0F|nr:DUF2142 domain-containing protein [Dorea longicatena]
MKENKKNRKYIIICLSLWLVFCISLLVSYKEEWTVFINEPHIVYHEGINENGKTKKLNEGDSLIQKFKADYSEMTGIALKMNAESVKKCVVKVKLISEEDNKCIQSWKQDLGEVKNNNYYNFTLKKTLKNTKNNKYIVQIDVLKTEGKAAYINLYNREDGSHTTLLCNNKKMKGVISYQIENGIHIALKKYAFAFFVGTAICFSGMLFGCLKKKKIEKLFVFSAAVIGIMYIFAISPFSVPDESRHFATAYAQSSSITGKQTLDAEGRVIMNSSIWTQGQNPTRDSYIEAVNGMTGHYEKGKNISTIPPLNGPYYFAYIPQVIGLVCARMIGLNPIQIVYAGRISALLIYCLIMYLAIKIMPYKKSMLYVIGMLPMTLQQVMSYSYDSTLIDLSFLMFAILVNQITREEGDIDKKIWVVFVVSMVIVATIKFVYLPMWGLILFVSSGTKRKKIKKYIGCAVGIIMSGGVILLSKIGTIQAAVQTGTAAVDASAEKVSLSYCLQNPKLSIEIVWRTLERMSSDYLEQLVGTSLGRLNISIPVIILVGFVAILFISMLEVKNENIHIPRTVRYWSIFSILIVGGMVLASMFLGWTPIGSNMIQGVQGRYFLPVLPLVGVIYNNKTIVLEKRLDNYLMIICVFLNCYTLYFVILSGVIKEALG